MKNRIILLLASVMISGGSALFAQNKLAITDKARFLNDKIESVLLDRLAAETIGLTSIIDTKRLCDYLFATLLSQEKELLLTVADCNDRVVGAKNLGSGILTASDQEKGILLYFALSDIIKNPGKFIETPEAKKESVSSDENRQYELTPPDPGQHKSRYFFAPSSYNLESGELYYNTLYFFIHDVQYGITDRFSMGMGTTIIGMPFYLTPKITFPVDENSAFAVGDLMMIGTFGTNFFGNLLYATYSRGGPFNNITLGGGWLHTSDNEITNTSNTPVVNMSFLLQASAHIYFLSENYISGFKSKQSAYYSHWDPVTFEGTYYEEKFKQNIFFIYGMTGFRFINKVKDTKSWQFGLNYLFTSFEDLPFKYKSNYWNTSAEGGSKFLAFPVIGYARKFSTKY